MMAMYDRCEDTTILPQTSPKERPGLTREEEVDLSARVARGDREARDRMVEANLGLVHTVARGFLGRGLEFDDLVGEGHLGLLRATGKFDPRFGARFSTYAGYWIRHAIREALMNTVPTIRLPAYMVKLLTRWRRAERALRRQTGEAPSFGEIASSLGLSADQRRMVAHALESRRLHTEGGSSDEEVGARLLVEATGRDEGVEERVEADDERDAVLGRWDRLDARERMVLALHYGLGAEAETLRQIGQRLGMTREWVRKIEVRALHKLGEA